MPGNKEHLLPDAADVDNEEPPAALPPGVKRIILLVLGILSIALLLSYIFVTFPVGDILRGKLVSKVLDGNKLELREFTLFFENNTATELENYYHQQQKAEFSLCLQGKKEGSDYVVTSFYQPKMYRQAFNQVSFEPCDERTLLILHTHPYKRCVASQTDLNTLKKMQERSPDVLMVVMCEPKRWTVYG